MKLQQLLNVLSGAEFLRIGTEKGKGFIAHDRTIHLDASLPDWVKEREVNCVYSVERREIQEVGSKPTSGIAIIIAGDENGHIIY